MSSVVTNSPVFDMMKLLPGKAVRLKNVDTEASWDCLIKHVDPLKLVVVYYKNKKVSDFWVAIDDIVAHIYEIEVL